MSARKKLTRSTMAAASLEVTAKKKNKNPQSAKIVLLPSPGKPVKAIVCVATMLPCVRAFFGDRAQNAFPFVNPYVGALMAHNLSRMMAQAQTIDSDMPERLYPGITPRLLSMIKSNLTKPGDTYRPEFIEQIAVGIKGRAGPHTKFVDALEGSILEGPLVWTPDTNKPFLPISMALAAGHSWASIIDELRQLLRRSEGFIEEWAWHGEALMLTGEQLHLNRKERRTKKSPTHAADD